MAVCKYCSAEIDFRQTDEGWRTFEAGETDRHKCPEYKSAQRGSNGAVQTYARPRQAVQQSLDTVQLVQAMDRLREAVDTLTAVLVRQHGG